MSKKTQDAKKQKINDEITAKTVRVIGPKGEKLGLFLINKALEKAEEYDLDLVEVSPGAEPPVCKLMDYGKIKYSQAKKNKSQKKNQHKSVNKIIKMKPNISSNDLERKICDIQKFLDKKYNVSVQLVMRGRQKNFSDLAESNTINKIKESLERFIIRNIDKQPGKIIANFAPEK